jgi:hypothetical protein
VNEQEKPVMMNTLLANTLLNASGKVPILKFFDWAKALSKAEVIDLDNADQKLLKDWIENHDGLTVLAKKRMLDVFDHSEMKLKK